MKFSNPAVTESGDVRASVRLTSLETLWINTGTLCNLSCEGCYIESSPTNDALVYISCDEVRDYLDQLVAGQFGTKVIGFTGGEPFMNPEFMQMLELVLSRGFEVLVLSNAMRPMEKHEDALLALLVKYPAQLAIRVSIDHFIEEKHEEIRGRRSWIPMIKGLKWLSDKGFSISVASRKLWDDSDEFTRKQFGALFSAHDIKIDARDAGQLLLFPEMDEKVDVPEITTKCWGILGVSPDDMMCATSRMVVKLKGDAKPSITACTLLPYDKQFNLGADLKGATGSVALNHPHCAKFCVLGGASCGG